MNVFSRSSLEKLQTCHSDLQRLAYAMLKVIDFAVIEGHRSEERQTELFNQGLSKVKAGHSKHNADPSNAFDLAPTPIDWKDEKKFYYLAGILLGVASQLGISIRWGGDWDSDNDLNDQSFMDIGHFELRV